MARKPGEIDISANAQRTYDMVYNYTQDLCKYLKDEHEYKLATYGFVKRNLYLLRFHTKNKLFEIKNRDLLNNK